jgi:anti-sigma regulatory factor (Ser/Thr protein kinase)
MNAAVLGSPGATRFRHEALFYSGMADFVDRVGGFIREGAEAGETIFVVVCEEKIDPLRSILPKDSRNVFFADMRSVGRNPARIIPAWQEFLDTHGGRGQGIRGVGEPIWDERSPDELVECQRHEALLNVAFGDGMGWRLACPYDRESLPPEVLDEARRSHPLLLEGDSYEGSDCFVDSESVAQSVAEPLRPPQTIPEVLHFGAEDLGRVRRFVARNADALEFSRARKDDLLLGTHEVAANSVRHGGGEGTVSTWIEGDTVLVEVTDAGRIDDPLAGRRRPTLDVNGGAGLWIANQLCDLVQIRSAPTRTVVRLHMSR